jgi:hypothetical protein
MATQDELRSSLRTGQESLPPLRKRQLCDNLGCRSAAFLQKLPWRPQAKSNDPLRAAVVLTLRILHIFGGQAAACIAEASVAVLGLPGRASWRPTCGAPRVPFKGRMMSHLRHEILNRFAASMAWHDLVAIATCSGPTHGLVAILTASCHAKLSAKSLGISCRNRDIGSDS